MQSLTDPALHMVSFPLDSNAQQPWILYFNLVPQVAPVLPDEVEVRQQRTTCLFLTFSCFTLSCLLA